MVNLIGGLDFSVVAFIGILFAFAFTCIAIAKFEKFLPRDMGRAFAHDGKLSARRRRWIFLQATRRGRPFLRKR